MGECRNCGVISSAEGQAGQALPGFDIDDLAARSWPRTCTDRFEKSVRKIQRGSDDGQAILICDYVQGFASPAKISNFQLKIATLDGLAQ